MPPLRPPQSSRSDSTLPGRLQRFWQNLQWVGGAGGRGCFWNTETRQTSQCSSNWVCGTSGLRFDYWTHCCGEHLPLSSFPPTRSPFQSPSCGSLIWWRERERKIKREEESERGRDREKERERRPDWDVVLSGCNPNMLHFISGLMVETPAGPQGGGASVTTLSSSFL